jgi:uncharacterized cupin superfamily protein
MTPMAACLIDMSVPPGGGPPPHRHNFQESFTLLEGEIEATFRGEKSVVRAGETLSIPANATFFYQRIRADDATVVHMLAGRTGGVFRADRCGRGDPDDTAAEARQGRARGVHEDGHGACAQVPLGTAAPLTSL